MYLVDPLKKLLPAIVDFDLVNSGKTRFTLGLTTVQTGQMRYFEIRKKDWSRARTRLECASTRLSRSVDRRRILLGSAASIQIRRLRWCLTKTRGEASVVFAIQIWHTRGPRPESLSHAFMREKDILFGTRSKTHIMRQAQLHRMRRIIRELVDMLPEEQKRSPRVKELAGWSCTTTMHLVEINAQPIEGETNARDYDFSHPAVQARLAGGLRRHLPDVGAAAVG